MYLTEMYLLHVAVDGNLSNNYDYAKLIYLPIGQINKQKYSDLKSV